MVIGVWQQGPDQPFERFVFSGLWKLISETGEDTGHSNIMLVYRYIHKNTSPSTRLARRATRSGPGRETKNLTGWPRWVPAATPQTLVSRVSLSPW
eukprot:3950386-Pyramimonas_sp.AAC.1